MMRVYFHCDKSHAEISRFDRVPQSDEPQTKLKRLVMQGGVESDSGQVADSWSLSQLCFEVRLAATTETLRALHVTPQQGVCPPPIPVQNAQFTAKSNSLID